ncbi:MAG TPA: hypothetical protein VGH26_01700 [Gaiellaceae bacterium]
MATGFACPTAAWLPVAVEELGAVIGATGAVGAGVGATEVRGA